MPDTLSREELAAIRERDASALHGDEDSADYMVCVTDREALLAHIDALTAALEAEWYNGNLDEKAYRRLCKVAGVEAYPSAAGRP